MYWDNNQGNPIAHTLGFRVITEGIKKELASPSSMMQKGVSACVKEELPSLLKDQLLAPHRGCASACMHQPMNWSAVSNPYVNAIA